jgi:adenine/guanine phosphoribosyltransferase-like PRPP-binding protein
VRGVFAIRNKGIFRRVPQKLHGARILLVDDVLTTGATAAACARVLKQAGAKHVALLTVARTDRRIGLEHTNTNPSNPETASAASAGSGTL